MPAGRALEDISAAVPLVHVPAGRAGAGGVAGVHWDQLASGAFCLVLNQFYEGSPSSI